MPTAMHLDHDRCCAVVRAKDPRYDGWFVTGVLSTGIYCRPSCPAITPRVRNMRFYASAAAAQGAGFRACKRCLPDATPGSPEWHVRGDVAGRAVRLIADGVVDREGVPGLAARLGYSTRQLERVLQAELGAGPLALARAQRAQAARLLVEHSDLTMAQAAHAAGFSSIRSFNDTVRQVYADTPSALRAAARRRSGGGSTPGRCGAVRTVGPVLPSRAPVAHQPGHAAPGALTSLALRLPFRGPLHVPSLFGHLVATAVPGLEDWDGTRLRRVLDLPGGPGVVELLPPSDGDGQVEVVVRLSDVADLSAAIGRCRRLLDLDADPEAVDDHLRLDPLLAPLVRSAAGVRIPGAVDGGEMALRTVLGQHISTAAAATHTARLVADLGAAAAQVGPSARLFPRPEVVASAPEELLPRVPATRRRTLRAVAAALADGALELGPGADRERARADLLALPGVGPWTTEMVLLRGLGDPDAFPGGDLGVRLSATAAGLPADPRGLHERAQAWRPWRSYATALLWAASDHAAARLPARAPDPPAREADRAAPHTPAVRQPATPTTTRPATPSSRVGELRQETP